MKNLSPGGACVYDLANGAFVFGFQEGISKQSARETETREALQKGYKKKAGGKEKTGRHPDPESFDVV